MLKIEKNIFCYKISITNIKKLKIQSMMLTFITFFIFSLNFDLKRFFSFIFYLYASTITVIGVSNEKVYIIFNFK